MVDVTIAKSSGFLLFRVENTSGTQSTPHSSSIPFNFLCFCLLLATISNSKYFVSTMKHRRETATAVQEQPASAMEASLGRQKWQSSGAGEFILMSFVVNEDLQI